MGTISELFHFINLPKERETEWEKKYNYLNVTQHLKTAKAKYIKGLKTKTPKMEEEMIQDSMFD